MILAVIFPIEDAVRKTRAPIFRQKNRKQNRKFDSFCMPKRKREDSEQVSQCLTLKYASISMNLREEVKEATFCRQLFDMVRGGNVTKKFFVFFLKKNRRSSFAK